MLLDDFLEAGVVQLRVFRQVVNISDDVADISLQQLKVFLKIWILLILRLV